VVIAITLSALGFLSQHKEYTRRTSPSKTINMNECILNVIARYLADINLGERKKRSVTIIAEVNCDSEVMFYCGNATDELFFSKIVDSLNQNQELVLHMKRFLSPCSNEKEKLSFVLLFTVGN
jgi:hypothetical protein